MKGFELSRNSWHFKLYKYDGKWGEPENFCDYFWTVVLIVLKYTAIFSILSVCVFGLFKFIFEEPFAFLFVVSFFTLIGSIGAKYEEIKERKRQRRYENTGPGFFELQWKSIKGRFCPRVEWVD